MEETVCPADQTGRKGSRRAMKGDHGAMIKNILFDMGNVLVRWDPPLFIQRLNLPEDDGKILMNEVFRSIEWVQLDRGTLDDEGALARMYPRIPERLHEAARTLVTSWDKPRIPMEETDQLVKELSENGYGLYLLSNASLRHPEYWPTLPVSRYFGDRLMISAQWNLLKPDPAFYEKALSMFHLQAEECVFIDDSPANVEGAALLGIHGIVYHQDPQLLRIRLRELGVNI